jgi:hypothetical protein
VIARLVSGFGFAFFSFFDAPSVKAQTLPTTTFSLFPAYSDRMDVSRRGRTAQWDSHESRGDQESD